MRDLLRQLACVPLSLAAYNAGPAPVQRCGSIPPHRGDRGYVAASWVSSAAPAETPAGGGWRCAWWAETDANPCSPSAHRRKSADAVLAYLRSS